ncbi:putative Phosphoadenosine phosphosulfate reductase CysH [Magnetospira sp. QH-2]|nr:putative Phosphoadenosine phosphosulfate reductase CysH [Magnetospira sp. QH-2]
MTVLQDIRAYAESKDAFELLECLLKEKFPGKTVVTASLKAKSVVLLKMVAEIAPDTPVVFCHAQELYEESRAYRDKLVEQLGLTNVRESHGDRGAPDAKDTDHFECLWAEDPDGGGLIHECVHLNEVLAPFDCWISAVYADSPDQNQSRQRVDLDGRLFRVDALADWAPADVQTFLLDYDIPLHPRAQGNQKSTRRDFGKSDTVYYSY